VGVSLVTIRSVLSREDFPDNAPKGVAFPPKWQAAEKEERRRKIRGGAR